MSRVLDFVPKTGKDLKLGSTGRWLIISHIHCFVFSIFWVRRGVKVLSG